MIRSALVVWLGAAMLVVPSVVSTAADNCPAEGDATDRGRADPDLNRLKNREEVPDHFRAIEFSELFSLPAPPPRGKSDHRRRWPREALQEITQKESQSVSAVGYLLGVKQEGKESPNCHGESSGDRDFHLWLAASPDDSRAESVVVEVTPRIRAKRAAWSLKNLKRFVKQRSKVRVSGWLMLDPEHPEQLGLTRKSLWEIHPVLRLEIWSGGRWVEL